MSELFGSHNKQLESVQNNFNSQMNSLIASHKKEIENLHYEYSQKLKEMEERMIRDKNEEILKVKNSSEKILSQATDRFDKEMKKLEKELAELKQNHTKELIDKTNQYAKKEKDFSKMINELKSEIERAKEKISLLEDTLKSEKEDKKGIEMNWKNSLNEIDKLKFEFQTKMKEMDDKFKEKENSLISKYTIEIENLVKSHLGETEEFQKQFDNIQKLLNLKYQQLEQK